jgi:ATP-dependent RNA helicase DeaD
VLPIYGGQADRQQLRALKRGVDVVVATPGRALDHCAAARSARPRAVVVLDEADEMLDMGFAEDLEAILARRPGAADGALLGDDAAAHRRIASGTCAIPRGPHRARATARRPAPRRGPAVAYVVPRAHKLAALGRVLDLEAPASALVFCRTRIEVDELAETLGGRGYRAEALHGGMSQEQRDRVMKPFRDGAIRPAGRDRRRRARARHRAPLARRQLRRAPTPEAYVHRIGRTGRAGREGVAITLAEPREHRLLRNIERKEAPQGRGARRAGSEVQHERDEQQIGDEEGENW